MPTSPAAKKRVFTFIDGQNLFRSAMERYGYFHPNYDVVKLSRAVVDMAPDRELSRVKFYTGAPTYRDDPGWHDWWNNKISAMRRQGVEVVRRDLRYRPLKYTVVVEGVVPPRRGDLVKGTLKFRDREYGFFLGKEHEISVGQEKGIDIRIALDLVALTRARAFDVAVVFSQDTDLEEAVNECKAVAKAEHRFIEIECAYPMGGTLPDGRGLRGTTWRRIDRAVYDACIDPRDYRPPRFFR